MNLRKNPKGRIRYNKLFLKGGMATFMAGTMVGMSKSAEEPNLKKMISGGRRMGDELYHRVEVWPT